MSDSNENDTHDFDDDITNRRLHAETQIADILGAIDGISAAAGLDRDPEIRLQALSIKLRHFEMERHHLALIELEEEARHRTVAALETMSEGVELWLKQQREISVAPGHAVRSLRGMGIKIEASGAEDSPLFQKVSQVIESLSVDMANQRKAQIDRELDEYERDREHDRQMERDGKKTS